MPTATLSSKSQLVLPKWRYAEARHPPGRPEVNRNSYATMIRKAPCLTWRRWPPTVQMRLAGLRR